MWTSVSSARRVGAGVIGAGLVAGSLLFGATGTAQAAPAPVTVSGPMSAGGPAFVNNEPAVIPAVPTGFGNAPQPEWFFHHHHHFFGHHHHHFFRHHHHFWHPRFHWWHPRLFHPWWFW